MNRLISFESTLVFYDGVQVFEGRDQIGGHYIGLAIDGLNGAAGTHALFGVSPEKLQQFRLGKTDLRSLILNRPSPSWFVGSLVDSNQPIDSIEYSDAVPEIYLPDDGFFGGSETELDSAWVLKESTARNRLALEVSFESSAPSGEHRISAKALGGALIHIQSLVKNAYQKSLAMFPGKHIVDSEMAMLDVAVPAMPGSFRMLLMPSEEAVNLFGESEMSKALEAVDFLLEDFSDPDKTLEHVQKFSGRTASSMVRLLSFLNEFSLSMKYAWTAPDMNRVVQRSMPRPEVFPVLEKLVSAHHLDIEKRVFVGILFAANDKTGAWGIETLGEKKVYHGKVRDGVSLGNVTINGIYTIECEEETEEITGTGREVRTLYLSSVPKSGDR